ncbi:MAG TPA: amidohydrolase family protein, partial [Acidimicrobiales bacterium]
MQTTLGADPYTRAEFETFKAFVTKSYTTPDDIAKVRAARLLLIHGCGMDTSGPGRQDTVDFLKTYGITVIWSPVSNLLLYQDTTNVLPLLDAGVPVVLGTDWTPSGSKTVWEEAKFAAEVLEAHRWKGDVELTCFRAITSVAADSLGLPLGRVKAGNFADVLIVRRPRGAKRGTAITTFRTATDEDVRGVLVGGVPLYGDADVLRAFRRKPSPLPGEQRAKSKGTKATVASTKAVALPDGCELTLGQLEEAIEAADHVIGKRRPRFLVADDADYCARMDELRSWVRGFDPKKSPNPKPVPPPANGLAPGEQEWMYNASNDPSQRMPDEVVELLGRVAPCRDVNCEVPKRHPYYHAEVLTEAGDSYGMRVPCMPVVPVLTNTGQLFVMGDYPTAKFAARSTNNLPVITVPDDAIGSANKALAAALHGLGEQPHGGDPQIETYIEEIADVVRRAYARPDIDPDAKKGYGYSKHDDYVPPRKNQFFVPVADVFAPMQDANYFDGYKVRNVAAGVFMQESYLKPLGVDIDTQVWLTNMIKCFLFHQSMADSYEALGWTDVKVEQSYTELLDVAKVCSQWIDEEVKVCDPKLVLTVGKPPCTLLHGLPHDDPATQGRVYNTLLGQLLKANDTKAETNVAKHLKLMRHTPSSDMVKAVASAGAATAQPSKRRPEPAPEPLSILRHGPWAAVNVFHML